MKKTPKQSESRQTEKAEKKAEVHRAAYELFSQGADWVTFFREILGVGGIVRRMYPSRESLREFERTETYNEIQQMLARLREREMRERTAKPKKQETPVQPDEVESYEEEGAEASQEQVRVITVRLPESLHDVLKEEAHEHRTSINKLCISKLLQFIDKELVPEEIPGRRKRSANSPGEAKK